MEPSHHGQAPPLGPSHLEAIIDILIDHACPECGATATAIAEYVNGELAAAYSSEYAATQQALVLSELRGDIKALRDELAPVLRLVAQLQQLPKIAKALGQAR